MAKKAQQYAVGNQVIEFNQLTAAATATDSIDLRIDMGEKIFPSVLFQVTLASVTTSVAISLQGSLDDINWFNLDPAEATKSFTADGAYGIVYNGEGEINFIRFYWNSETGGTAATLDVKAKIFGNPVDFKG